ncbi:MAG: Ig-like domain-containing protein [Deltaproteobacteria bacterium]|nr:Ig-like domain-containing protein [Deltaproteobacteria bacterium]
MKRTATHRMLAALFLVTWPGTAGAALSAVSPALDPTGNYPLWYQDAAGLQLELCNFNNGFCLFDPTVTGLGVGLETFWWSADVVGLPIAGSTLGANLILAIEGTFDAEPAAAGGQIAFGRIRIRVDAASPGNYTITHPFGTHQETVTTLGAGYEINFTADIGCLAGPCNFAGALATTIGPYLYWDAGLPLFDLAGAAGNNAYVGDGVTEHKVFGSPTGDNFFRVMKDGVVLAETDKFVVSGKVFTNGGAANTAPVANADPGPFFVPAGGSLAIDVLANDAATNVAINPTSMVAAASANGGTVAPTRVGNKVLLTYTPAAGFSGTDTFTYTVQSFTGLPSAPATVTVFVERLEITEAELSGKLMKWNIRGLSSDAAANTVDIYLGATVNAAGLPTGPLLAQARPVAADGTWSFSGKSTLSPASVRTISVVSANGIKLIGLPLRMK